MDLNNQKFENLFYEYPAFDTWKLICYVAIDRTKLGSTVIITGVNRTVTEDRTKKICIVGIGR